MSQSDDSESQPDADGDAPSSKKLKSENAHKFMVSDLSLLETADFSDVILRCGNKAWNVHKSIVCKRCVWFEKALTGSFEEAETKKITLTDIAPELVEVVVRYLYSGAIDNAAVQKCEGDSIVSKYVSLWSVADFFLLEPLQKDVISAIEGHFEVNMKLMCDAKWYIGGDEGKAIVQEFFSGAAATYRHFPHAKPCREVLIDYAHAIRLNLYRSDDFVQRIDEFPELASDLFLVAVKGRESRWAGSCKADYRNYWAHYKCMGCKCVAKETASWHVDPQTTGKNIRIMEVSWKCETCVGKSGYPWEGRRDAQPEK
ncbi:hypothetical protein INS49_013910 [Diaporthe citri]|uniref:uncharacterized protein n=1 Tax=Diaporthe citri TaxID=83186 RepID=UPI001C7E547C|nr:uncharacterized protein INS49_013910 [Diaporthe citri]KAG6358026.1 hypothetical protein INS49_013910 [Diaporthe citri]